MANKSFGTKQLDLTGASGSPIITSPSDLSINATTVAISTNISVGGYFASNVNVGTGYSVGIGTTIPIEKLQVSADTNTTIRINNADDSEATLYFHNTGSHDRKIVAESADMIFYGGSGAASEHLRIKSDGNVGIGTDNPATKLDVNGGLTVKALNINTSGAGDGDLLSNGGSDGIFGIFNTTNSGDTLFSLKDSGGTSKERLRIIGATDTTFAGSDDIVVDGGNGIAETTQVTGTINMGSSYLNTGHTNGSGHYSAVKLHLYKLTTGTNAETIDNVYGLSLIHI